MSIFEIIFLALALAMDAFAVSLGVGAKLGRVNPRQFFRLAWHFGLFQAGMPVVGWTVGSGIQGWITAVDHWIAFALLVFIGAKMIKEAFENKGEGIQRDPSRGMSLVALSVATSIDALAVGFTFSVVDISVWFPSLVIGIVAAGMTILGLYLGSKAVQNMFLGPMAEFLGGIVLKGVGIKILLVSNIFS